MKKSIAIFCTAISVAVVAATIPVEASAQKRTSVSSTKSRGAKAGGSIYKPNKSHAVVPRRVEQNTPKPKRRNPTRLNNDRNQANQRLNNRRSAASSLLSRAPNPFEPKLDTSRMSMDVNASGGLVRSKPITPPPPTTAPPPLPPSRARRPATQSRRSIDFPAEPLPKTMRQARSNAAEIAREIKPQKVRVVGMRVPAATQQKSILVTRKRSQTHGRGGLTFNKRDQFQAVDGSITTARAWNGKGPINAIMRKYKGKN